MVKLIYNYEGTPIGEESEGRICWYYSDGSAGGENGGHEMGTVEFLEFNGLLDDCFKD